MPKIQRQCWLLLRGSWSVDKLLHYVCIRMLIAVWCENWEGALVVWWLRLVLSTWSRRVQVPPVSGFFISLSRCLTSMPWNSLSSTLSKFNKEVFHRILRRGYKAVGPGGPGTISLGLFQALASHYYSSKPEEVITLTLCLLHLNNYITEVRRQYLSWTASKWHFPNPTDTIFSSSIPEKWEFMSVWLLCVRWKMVS